MHPHTHTYIHTSTSTYMSICMQVSNVWKTTSNITFLLLKFNRRWTVIQKENVKRIQGEQQQGGGCEDKGKTPGKSKR